MWALTKIAGWILGNAVWVFVGGEVVKGWFLGDVAPVLASFAGWPLYLALSVACVLTFFAANWLMATKCIEYVRAKKHLRLHSEREKAKNALKKINEFCRLLENGEESDMRSWRLNVLHERLSVAHPVPWTQVCLTRRA